MFPVTFRELAGRIVVSAQCTLLTLSAGRFHLLLLSVERRHERDDEKTAVAALAPADLALRETQPLSLMTGPFRCLYAQKRNK